MLSFFHATRILLLYNVCSSYIPLRVGVKTLKDEHVFAPLSKFFIG